MLDTNCVQLTSGALRGDETGDLMVFRGIPYAAPPTGSHRFRPPQPFPPWSGVRDAMLETPIAPQLPSRVFESLGPISTQQSEDCLTLTVWAPKDAKGPLPVIVWLHGGGFSSGGGALPWYDGSELARRGFVVVAPNYRLGPLGYLSIPSVVPANLGLLDQEAALRWINREISAFGGDPSKVTAMGQSGGGHTIACLLLMPDTDALFQRAIIQSPPLGAAPYTAEEEIEAADVFLGELGFSRDDNDLLSKLQSASVEQLLHANAAANMREGRMARGDLRPLLMPARASYLDVTQAFVEESGKAAAERGVEIFIGWTKDEADLFLASFPPQAPFSAAEVEGVARLYGGEDSAQLVADAKARRPQGTDKVLFSDLITNSMFRQPSLEYADAVTRHGGRAFVYAFDWGSPAPGLNACHCAELPFNFGAWAAWSDTKLMRGMDEGEFHRLSAEMIDRWTAFAREGDPGVPHWTENKHPVLHLDVRSTVEQNLPLEPAPV